MLYDTGCINYYILYKKHNTVYTMYILARFDFCMSVHINNNQERCLQLRCISQYVYVPFLTTMEGITSVPDTIKKS